MSHAAQQTIAAAAALGIDVPRSHEVDAVSPEHVATARRHHRLATEELVAGRGREAVREACAAIANFPTWPAPYQTLGAAYAQLEEHTAAIGALEACMDLDPAYDSAYTTLAAVLSRLGRRDEALETWFRLERAVPGLAETRFAIGMEHLRRGAYDVALPWLDRGLTSPVPAPVEVLRMLPYGVVSLPRLHHDASQLAYLIERGKLDDSYVPVLAALRHARDLAQARPQARDWTQAEIWPLEPDLITMISRFYRRACHLGRADARPDGALNPRLDYRAIEASYFAADPHMIVVDDLLTPEALHALQQYCTESTIWHNDLQKGRNYLGAYRQNGIMCPLVEQIAEELAERLSRVFDGHRLTDLWGYRLVMGEAALGAHADSAVVNVNLWVTPDDANLDPETGGLLVYGRRAPEYWCYDTYNDDADKIEQQIRHAPFTRIPYRQNRAVLFDSGLFHGSDEVHFKSDFASARTNMTFLFGVREQASA